jgi:hypothetical protein
MFHWLKRFIRPERTLPPVTYLGSERPRHGFQNITVRFVDLPSAGFLAALRGPELDRVVEKPKKGQYAVDDLGRYRFNSRDRHRIVAIQFEAFGVKRTEVRLIPDTRNKVKAA